MQINNRKDKMSKIRMNTELRNKLFNKIKMSLRMRTRKNEKHIFNQEKMLINIMLLQVN